MFPMTDEPKTDMPDMGGDSLLTKALEASGVKGDKLSKLTAALDAWKGGDDSKLAECADDYGGGEKKDDPTSEEEPKEDKPKGGGDLPPFGGKDLAEKEGSAIKRATMKFGG